MSLSTSRRGLFVVAASLAFAGAVAPARSEEKADAQVLALQQAAIAAGKRTVVAAGSGSATRPVDEASARIVIGAGKVSGDNEAVRDSSFGPTAAELSRLDDLQRQIESRLRAANLPPPVSRGDSLSVWSPGVPRRRLGTLGTPVYASRVLTVALGARDWGDLSRALEPLSSAAPASDADAPTRPAADGTAIVEVLRVPHSSALDADPAAVQRDAQQAAIADAKEKAGSVASMFGLKLGPPVAVGQIETKQKADSRGAFGYDASVTVVFELID